MARGCSLARGCGLEIGLRQEGAVRVQGSEGLGMAKGCSNSVPPMQVLFSLAVTELDDNVRPLVEQQIALLDTDSWEELLGLIKDANPADGRPHTYPRSLAAAFSERLLSRYLRDGVLGRPSEAVQAGQPRAKKQPVVPREPRYFKLFVACTPSAAIPRYVVAMLDGQRHAPDDWNHVWSHAWTCTCMCMCMCM